MPADYCPEYLSDCVLYVPKGTAYLYYGYNEQPEYDTLCLDGSWDYSNTYLFFKDIEEEWHIVLHHLDTIMAITPKDDKDNGW